MKKRVSVIMLSLMLFSFFGRNVMYAQDFNNKVNSSEIIKYGEAHNTDLKILKEKIEIQQEKYDDTKDNKYRKYKTGNTQIERAKLREVYPIQTELELNNLKWEEKQKKQQVSLEIKKNYYNVIIQDKLIEMKENDIKRVEDKIKQVKKQIEVGNEAEISLMEHELLLEQAKLELKGLKDSRQKIIMDLNLLIGREPDEKLILIKEEIPYKEYKVENLDENIEKLIKEDYSVKKLKEEFSIASSEYFIVEKYNKGDKYDDELEAADDKCEGLRYDIDNQKKEIEYKAITDYNNLIKMNNKVLAAEIECDNKKALLEAAGVRKKLGYITEIEYIKYEQDVENALKDYEKAKLDYYIAVEDFKFFIN